MTLGVDRHQRVLRHGAGGKTQSWEHWKVGTIWCLFNKEQRCHNQDEEEPSGIEDMSYLRRHLSGNAEVHKHHKVLCAVSVWKT